MSDPMPSESVDPVLARKMWRTLEPFHGFIYFSTTASAAYAELGVTGRAGYFGSRSAPMGAVSPAVVVATFFNFDPRVVVPAMEGIWATVSPGDLVAARFAAVDADLQAVLGPDVLASDEMREAAALATEAAAACPPEGRPLFAAHAALVPPGAPHLQLWHAITLVREFRGDGHLAALLALQLDAVEALVTHAAAGDVPAAVLQATRGWSDEDWAAALDRLRARGLVEADGDGLTAAGNAVRDEVEARTDQLARAPWAQLGPARSDRLRELVRPWSRALVASGVFLQPPA